MRQIEALEREINSGKLPPDVLAKKQFQLNDLKFNLVINKSYYGYHKIGDHEVFAMVVRKNSSNDHVITILTKVTKITPEAVFPYLNNTFRISPSNE